MRQRPRRAAAGRLYDLRLPGRCGPPCLPCALCTLCCVVLCPAHCAACVCCCPPRCQPAPTTPPRPLRIPSLALLDLQPRWRTACSTRASSPRCSARRWAAASAGARCGLPLKLPDVSGAFPSLAGRCLQLLACRHPSLPPSLPPSFQSHLLSRPPRWSSTYWTPCSGAWAPSSSWARAWARTDGSLPTSIAGSLSSAAQPSTAPLSWRSAVIPPPRPPPRVQQRPSFPSLPLGSCCTKDC